MAYIKLTTESEADGKLAGIYEAARKRAGRVFNILKIQSQNADTLQAMLELYAAAVKGPSPLRRAQREMLAVVTSRANECH